MNKPKKVEPKSDWQPSVRVNARISAASNAWLDKMSFELGVTKSALISFAVEQMREKDISVNKLPELAKIYKDLGGLPNA